MPCVMVVMLRARERQCTSGSCSWLGSTALRCLLQSRHKANDWYLRTCSLCSVLPEQRRGLLHRWVLKWALLFSCCNITEFALNHMICMLTCEQSHEGQAGGDGPRCTSRRIKKTLLFSLGFLLCFSASSLFQKNVLLCVKACVRLQGYAIFKLHDLFFTCHLVKRKLNEKD